jgi:hypothetical protein
MCKNGAVSAIRTAMSLYGVNAMRVCARRWITGCGAATVIALVLGCGERPRHYACSASCRECHERFYELWAPPSSRKSASTMVIYAGILRTAS